MAARRRTSLVLGASGQDGTYLVKHLLAEGDRVIGCGRSLAAAQPANWLRAGAGEGAERRDLDYSNDGAVAALIAEVVPDAIYVLAGQSSVRLSFSMPAETIRSHAMPMLAVLEAVREQGLDTHVVFAGSTDCFGDTGEQASEEHAFRPQSPYGAGKLAGTLTARIYREAYGVRCSTAFLSNHESILRSADFLFGKILEGIAAIKRGEQAAIETGSLSIERDWGYAPEFVRAMADIAQLDRGCEVIIATGRTVVLRDAVFALIEAFGLDPAIHLRESASLAAPTAIQRQSWNPARARALLGWTPSTCFPLLADKLRDDWLAQPGVLKP